MSALLVYDEDETRINLYRRVSSIDMVQRDYKLVNGYVTNSPVHPQIIQLINLIYVYYHEPFRVTTVHVRIDGQQM